MTVSKVSELFAAMAKLSMDEVLDQMQLVVFAMEQVKARLKPDVDMALHSNLLSYVCASYAFYRYVLLRSASRVSGGFHVDGVTINPDFDRDVLFAKQVQEEFFIAAKDLLKDNASFVFCQMEGAV